MQRGLYTCPQKFINRLIRPVSYAGDNVHISMVKIVLIIVSGALIVLLIASGGKKYCLVVSGG